MLIFLIFYIYSEKSNKRLKLRIINVVHLKRKNINRVSSRYSSMVTLKEFQAHWLSKKCITLVNRPERQFVPKTTRAYITPGIYTKFEFDILTDIINHLKRQFQVAPADPLGDCAFMLLAKTSKFDDIVRVFDFCNACNIPLSDMSFDCVCNSSRQCRKVGHYDDYGTNSDGRRYAAQFIFQLYNKDQLSQLEKNLTFNTLKFIFEHNYVFNSRFRNHCYVVFRRCYHFFSKKQGVRLTNYFMENNNDDDGEQELSTDSNEFMYCSDCGNFGYDCCC